MVKYKFIKHTADIKFQAFGKDVAECFKNSAYALKEIITKDKIKPILKKTIKVSGKDYESLLYSFLEEFLFLIDTKDMIMSQVESIEIEKNKKEIKLSATVYFDFIKKYKNFTNVKAITYNDMYVLWQEPYKKCELQVVVDV